MTYLAVLTLSEGRRSGLAAVAGVALGLAIIGLLAALGVGALISASPFLYHMMRFAGVCYLLWLAWETWSGTGEPDPAVAGVPDHQVLWTAFRNGLVTNLLNPKAAVFYVAVLPLFLDASRPTVGQAVVLAGVYVAIATAIHLAIVLLADRVRPLLIESGKSQSVNRVFAVMLAGIAIWMGWATRR
jgi:threonine/homoserine/homoserine lactone efflux protein